MMKDIKAEHKEARVLVERLLEKYQRARNDDTFLMLKFWEEMQLIEIKVPEEQIGMMCKAESITRARRRLQNQEHKLLPTDPQVLVRRRVNEEVLREFYSEEPSIIELYEEIAFGIK